MILTLLLLNRCLQGDSIWIAVQILVPAVGFRMLSERHGTTAALRHRSGRALAALVLHCVAVCLLSLVNANNCFGEAKGSTSTFEDSNSRS